MARVGVVDGRRSLRRLRLRQTRVRQHDADGGVGARTCGGVGFLLRMRGRLLREDAERLEGIHDAPFSVAAAGDPGTVRAAHVAERVHRHDGARRELAQAQSADSEPGFHGALAAEELAHRCAASGAHVAFGQRFRRLALERRPRSSAPHGGIGMGVLPDQQIEQAGSHDDGHAGALHGKADAACGQLVHDAGRGGQPEGAAARQDHAVHGLDHVLGLEQIGLSRGRTAAAHVDAAGGPVRSYEDGAAGARAGVLGVRAEECGQIGERCGLQHGVLPSDGADRFAYCTPRIAAESNRCRLARSWFR